MRDTHDRPQRLRLAFAFVGLIFGVSHLLRIVIENALDILETFWRSLCPARSYLGHCEDGRTTRQAFHWPRVLAPTLQLAEISSLLIHLHTSKLLYFRSVLPSNPEFKPSNLWCVFDCIWKRLALDYSDTHSLRAGSLPGYYHVLRIEEWDFSDFAVSWTDISPVGAKAMLSRKPAI